MLNPEEYKYVQAAADAIDGMLTGREKESVEVLLHAKVIMASTIGRTVDRDVIYELGHVYVVESLDSYNVRSAQSSLTLHMDKGSNELTWTLNGCDTILTDNMVDAIQHIDIFGTNLYHTNSLVLELKDCDMAEAFQLLKDLYKRFHLNLGNLAEIDDAIVVMVARRSQYTGVFEFMYGGEPYILDNIESMKSDDEEEKEEC